MATVRAAELEAVLIARDQMKAVLAGARGEANQLKQALQQVNESGATQQVTRSLQENQQAWQSVNEQARQHRGLLSTLLSPLSSIRNSLGGIATMAAGMFGGNVLFSAAQSGFALLKEGAIGFNAQLETATLQFTTLMGNADEAKQHVQSIFQFATQTPYFTQQLIAASRIMRVFGGDALDSRANLQLFGDAAAAVGAPVDNLAQAAAKMYAEIQGGKPLGIAARELELMGALTPQVANQMEELQKQGASNNEVWKVYTDYLSRYSGAMKLQMNTWAGLTSTLKDTLLITMSTALKPFFDTLKDGLHGMIDLLNTPAVQHGAADFAQGLAGATRSAMQAMQLMWRGVQPTLIGFAVWFAQARAYMVPLLRDLWSWTQFYLWPVMVKLSGALLDVTKGLVTGLLAGIRSLIPDPLVRFAELLGGAVVGALSWISDHGEIVKAALLGMAGGFAAFKVIQFAQDLNAALGAVRAFMAMEGVWATVNTALGLSELLVDAPLLLIAGAIAAVIAIGYLLLAHWNELLPLAKQLGTALSEDVSAGLRSLETTGAEVLGWFQEHWPTLLALLGGPLGLVIDMGTGNLGKVKDDILNFFKQLQPHVTPVLDAPTGGTNTELHGAEVHFPSTIDPPPKPTGPPVSSAELHGAEVHFPSTVDTPPASAWDRLKSWFGQVFGPGGMLGQLFSNLGRDVNGWVQQVFGVDLGKDIEEAFAKGGAGAATATLLGGLAGIVTRGMAGVGAAFATWFNQHKDDLGNWLDEHVYRPVDSWARDPKTKMAFQRGITAAWDGLMDFLTGKNNAIGDWLDQHVYQPVDSFMRDPKTKNDMIELGKSLWSGLEQGLETIPPIWFVTHMKDIWDEFVKFWQTGSPSKLMASLGDDVMAGFQQGLSAAVPGILSWADNFLGGLKQKFTDAWSWIAQNTPTPNAPGGNGAGGGNAGGFNGGGAWSRAVTGAGMSVTHNIQITGSQQDATAIAAAVRQELGDFYGTLGQYGISR